MKPLLLLISLLAGTFAFAQNATIAMDSAAVSPDSTGLYGLVGEKPVKVGGSPSMQRAYLERLRDPKGKPVKYERVGGGCCAYESKNGLMGYALVDTYEISYRDAEGKKRKARVYISFYDFEEPKPINGFTFAD